MSVPAVTGSSGPVRFHLQRLWFPSPGSLVIGNQTLLGRAVVLGKLPKMFGQEPMSFQRGNGQTAQWAPLPTNIFSLNFARTGCLFSPENTVPGLVWFDPPVAARSRGQLRADRDDTHVLPSWAGI